MKTAGAIALLILAAMAVPTAQAQAQGVIAAPVALEAPIPYEGSADLTVEVTVGCATILEAMAGSMDGSAPLTLTVESPPSWLTVGESSAELADPTTAEGCLNPEGMYTHTATLPLTVSKDAPGVVDHTIQVVATVGTEASEPASAIINVAYHVNYTITSDAKFPLMVNGTEVSFNVTITQASNARSMVMIEGLSSTAGVFSGIAALYYENEAGKPFAQTHEATFKAPTGEWTNATATFTGYGHYALLDGRAGSFGVEPCQELGLPFPVCDVDGKQVTYSFVAGHSDHDEHDEEDSNDAPAPAGVLLALGLVALAGLVRRRA